MIFREDYKDESTPRNIKYFTRIGVVKLNQAFEQISDCAYFDTKSTFSEDPRVIQFKGKWFLIYNDRIKGASYSDRGIYFAELSESLEEIIKIYPPFFKYNEIEKNWTPFISHDGYLKISYRVFPHIVFQFDLNECGDLCLINSSNQYSPVLNWQKKYGELRGGTPAITIDDKLISFFHSSKRVSSGKWQYFFGAIAYSGDSPHDVVAISPQPIQFNHIYESPISPFADRNKKVIFPCGVVDLGDEILVSFGENDSATLVVKFSKAELLDSLISLQ